MTVSVVVIPSPSTTASVVNHVTGTAVVAAVRNHEVPAAKKKHPSISMLILYICLPLVLLAFIICAVVLIYLRLKRRRKIRHELPAYQNPAYDNTIYALPPPLRAAQREPPAAESRVYDTLSLPPPYEEEESPYDEIGAVGGKKDGVAGDSKHCV